VSESFIAGVLNQKGIHIMKRSKGLFLFLCVAPAVLLYTIFMIIPTLNVFRMSLFERGAYSPTETFVGLSNFRTLFTDAKFIASMQNTVLLIVVVTIFTISFALMFAAILIREKIWGKNFFRIVFYIPNVLSVVVIAGIFSAVYKPENGMLNSIFSMFSGKTIQILWKDQPMVIVSIIIAMVWQAIGYYMVMYMAAMSAVPESIYESSGLDGLGRTGQFFKMTLPLIWGNIRTTLTFFIISTINMAFLFVKAMVAKGMSDVGLSFMYNQKDAGLYGYSMAAGVVIFLFSFLLSAVVNKVTKREVLEM
jgi:N-acetylglucosamine transport system permease protein